MLRRVIHTADENANWFSIKALTTRPLMAAKANGIKPMNTSGGSRKMGDMCFIFMRATEMPARGHNLHKQTFKEYN